MIHNLSERLGRIRTSNPQRLHSQLSAKVQPDSPFIAHRPSSWRPYLPQGVPSKMVHNLGMDTETIHTVYDAAGGLDTLMKLAHAWHVRVLDDEVVSHAFSHGYHPQHTERLAAYWAEALGGPTTYSDQFGDE